MSSAIRWESRQVRASLPRNWPKVQNVVVPKRQRFWVAKITIDRLELFSSLFAGEE
jgi:hypothetical protein